MGEIAGAITQEFNRKAETLKFLRQCSHGTLNDIKLTDNQRIAIIDRLLEPLIAERDKIKKQAATDIQRLLKEKKMWIERYIEADKAIQDHCWVVYHEDTLPALETTVADIYIRNHPECTTVEREE